MRLNYKEEMKMIKNWFYKTFNSDTALARTQGFVLALMIVFIMKQLIKILEGA